jgi:hypothetical protein
MTGALGLAITISGCGSPATHRPAASLQHPDPAAESAASHSAASRVTAASADPAAAAPSTAGASSAPAQASSSPARAGSAPAFFRTLPPGAALPSGAQCAKWVRARPIRESKGVNRRFNLVQGQHLSADFLAGDAPAADKHIVPRVNGDFTGTTAEILRWAACKWGISQNIVFAQAAVESWWRQTTEGDWETSGCPPGHAPGADGRPGLCPQSWGILQNRYPYESSSWPGIERSTAMNADTAYAIWRSCYDGYETWLNTVTHVGTYHAGDVWGCVGRWFAGRWHTPPAQQYIAQVKRYLSERIWTTPDFQQP